MSASISMLYKRAFRKEKEVITFLIRARKSALGFVIELQPYRSEQMACCYQLT
jgi:hypothetical protein